MPEPTGAAVLDAFDRFVQRVQGLPDESHSNPRTILTTHPLNGQTTTHVVQTYRLKDEGFTLIVQRQDAEGNYRFVVPPAVMAVVYRQRQSLTDRSTPASRQRRARSRELERRRKAKAERRARAQAANQ